MTVVPLVLSIILSMFSPAATIMPVNLPFQVILANRTVLAVDVVAPIVALHSNGGPQRTCGHTLPQGGLGW